MYELSEDVINKLKLLDDASIGRIIRGLISGEVTNLSAHETVILNLIIDPPPKPNIVTIDRLKYIYKSFDRIKDEEFLNLYRAYPKKAKPIEAYNIWKELTREDKDNAVNALPLLIKSNNWTINGGQYIPYLVNYLLKSYWNTVVIAKEKEDITNRIFGGK